MTTQRLITADEIAEASQRIYDEWPRERFQDLRRYIMDTLHDARILAETYEDAARLRAKSSSPSPIDHSGDSARPNGTSETAAAFQPDHAKAFHKMAAAVFCPPAQDDEPDQRARNAGVGA